MRTLEDAYTVIVFIAFVMFIGFAAVVWLLFKVVDEMVGARDERRKDLADIHRVLTEKEDERINGKEKWGI